MNLYTIFGGKGFIGSEFARKLTNLGHHVYIPERNDSNIYNKDLGIVIYAAGHGDCINNSENVLDANTTLLNNILQHSNFTKIIYISSTRIYMNSQVSSENANILISFNDNRKLFNLTKMTSEEMCIRSGKEYLIIRPSNVYGIALDSPLFLPSIIRDAINKKTINMYITPAYSKDYVYLGDLVSSTLALIDLKKTGIFNVASGMNVDAKSISDLLIKKTGCQVNWLADFDSEKFPVIDISKLSSTISYTPASVLHDLSDMVDNYKLKMVKKSDS
ncbi:MULTISPECIES: NAD-dependent epimerase/dehydratase family protein [unclassified Providencia]|uniref:NAD-dependent epimerase/dehydratase family protein n=1 Tax=unclassified Providencia TaxID=2633465 RepID=UPI00234940AB|nr:MULTISPECIES: SDR family oxidoreductase [unclassified Providencia]HBK4773412.1 SDR family oxidoreductase [Providencia rettgeri]